MKFLIRLELRRAQSSSRRCAIGGDESTESAEPQVEAGRLGFGGGEVHYNFLPALHFLAALEAARAVAQQVVHAMPEMRAAAPAFRRDAADLRDAAAPTFRRLLQRTVDAQLVLLRDATEIRAWY